MVSLCCPILLDICNTAYKSFWCRNALFGGARPRELVSGYICVLVRKSVVRKQGNRIEKVEIREHNRQLGENRDIIFIHEISYFIIYVKPINMLGINE